MDAGDAGLHSVLSILILTSTQEGQGQGFKERMYASYPLQYFWPQAERK